METADALCTVLLVMYSRRIESIKAAFWAHIATFSAVIISAAVTLRRGELSLYHYMVAVQTAGSPMVFYLAIYAIRSWYGNANRMDALMGQRKGQWTRYGVVSIFALLVYICCWVLIWNPGKKIPFAQQSCGNEPYWFEVLSDPFSAAVGEITIYTVNIDDDWIIYYNFTFIVITIGLRSMTGTMWLVGIGLFWKRVWASGRDTVSRVSIMW
jgi:hypothetical protein